MRRGEIWLGNLNPNRGNEIGKIRPVLILQADFLSANDCDLMQGYLFSRPVPLEQWQHSLASQTV